MLNPSKDLVARLQTKSVKNRKNHQKEKKIRLRIELTGSVIGSLLENIK
jgi:hypothetical protein